MTRYEEDYAIGKPIKVPEGMGHGFIVKKAYYRKDELRIKLISESSGLMDIAAVYLKPNKPKEIFKILW